MATGLLHWAGGQGTDQWSQYCYIGLRDKVLTSGHRTATLGWGTRYDQWSQDCYIGLGDKVLTSGHSTGSLMQLNDVNAGRLIEHAWVRRGVATCEPAGFSWQQPG